MSANACGREQIAFEPDVAVAAVEHEGVDQRVDDQVVLLGRRPQEVPAIVEVHDHAADRRRGGRDDRGWPSR